MNIYIIFNESKTNQFFNKNESTQFKTQPDRLDILLEKQDRRIEKYAKGHFYKNYKLISIGNQ